MPEHDYVSCFPYPKMREQQKIAIEFILNAFESGKRFVVLQAPTGIGKSLIGLTVARYLNKYSQSSSAYLLTTQKILQDQYERDFGQRSLKMLRSLKSSSNYRCEIHTDQTCGESRRVLAALGETLEGTEFYNHCKFQCNYIREKRAFLGCAVGTTNFSYFLAETRYAGALQPRDLLVIDEAHAVEEQLSKFIEISFSERFSTEINCEFPTQHDDEHVFNWVKIDYKNALTKRINGVIARINESVDKDSKEFLSLSKHLEKLDKHICKVNRFIDEFNPENWILNIIEASDKKKRHIEFKPIDVSSFSEECLFKFGEKVLLMSATIVDKDVFCRTVGINPEQTEYLDMPSPFHSDKKPLYYLPVGSMAKKTIDVTLPVLSETIKLLLEQHKSEKGIIHTQSFKIVEHIKKTVKSKRLLFHSTDDRDIVLQQHLASKKPTVIVSPSMSEGVDLANDASRFQIVCKLPFPYLGDKLVVKRMNRDKMWYAYQTAKTLIQSLGRSVRNENDYAISYILDSDFDNFYKKNKHLFPDDIYPRR